jgi:uncharacterized protein
MGHDFFKSIEDILSTLNPKRFVNILQSNLILLDDWYVDFLKNNNFQVRTSLDLPPTNHDILRKDGDFERSIKSIEMLRKANVPININTVVTEKNINSAQEIFNFLKKMEITSFSVSRLVEQGNAVNRNDLILYDNAAFGRFLVELFDLWMADNIEPKIQRITPLDKLLNACKSGKREESKCFHCQSQLFAIGPDGKVFPSCNKFFAIPETCLGNVMNDSIPKILQSDERNKFLATTSSVSDRICSKCEYVNVCEGGCYYVAYNARKKGENLQSREHFCKGYYLVFERIFNYLKSKNEL